MKVKLTKVSDHTPGHSDVPIGMVIEGVTDSKPTKGSRFEVQKKKVYLNKEEILPVFSTSHVTEELDSKGIFKTKYSTYKLEIIE